MAAGNRHATPSAPARIAEVERARKTIDADRRRRFGIRNFYATPAEIRRGETASICYSVLGATTLRLDPPVAEVYPTFSHCLQARRGRHRVHAHRR
jgi:hypothetical protein